MYGTEPLVDKGPSADVNPTVPPRPVQTEIFRARSKDLPGIVNLECSRSRACTPEGDQRRSGFIMTKLAAEKLQELIQNPNDLVLVAKRPDSSEIAGALIIYGRETAIRTYSYLATHMKSNAACYVKTLLVARTQEGRGISLKLLRELREWLAEQKISEVLTEACIDPVNGPSLALINRAKMELVEEIPDTAKKVTWGLFRSATKL